MHGGSAPQVKAKAALRLAESRALLGGGKGEPVVDTIGALQSLAGELMQMKDDAREAVARLTEIRFTDDKGGEQLRSEVAIYERALAAAGKLLVDIARLNLEERVVVIDEKRSAVMVAVWLAVLADPEAGLEPERQDVLRRVLARHLRIVDA